VEESVLEGLGLKLQEKLPDLKLGYGADMTRNVLTLQRIQKYDMVILVETRGKSKYREIEKEVEIILNLKKDVMGYIVLDW